jgi:hypothetical protein
MSASHDAFLATMQAFFRGEVDAVGVEACLGKSPSGTARLALYATLVRRQRVSVLHHFFRSARLAAELSRTGSWTALVNGYTQEHEPSHWEPNRYAEAMVSHLARCTAHGATESFVHELADHAWIRYAAMLAPHGPSVTLGGDVHVREYEHDVATFARIAEAPDAAPASPPTRITTTLLVCRSRVTGRLITVRPSVAALLALVENAKGSEASLPAGTTAASVRAEAQALVELGVLPARSHVRKETAG